MRTLKLVILAFFTLISVNSCTVKDTANWYTDEFTIIAEDWKLVGGVNNIGSYFEYVFYNVPLDVSYHKGIVTAYLFLNYNSKDEVQTPLPYIEYGIIRNPDNSESQYSIQYTYDVKTDGSIAFKAYVSDYFTGDFNPGTQHFRVAIVW